jgi:two-component system chemotaxis response regulator CheB
MMTGNGLPVTSRHPIRVLVVDDSPATQEFAGYLFAADHEIEVIGTATNGEEALATIKNQKPDVVTMGLHTSKTNSYEVTRAIMECCPVPIVIVTCNSIADEAASPFSALEAGAVAVVKRPPGIEYPDHDWRVKELIQTVKLMSEVRVVKRWAPRKITGSAALEVAKPEIALPRTKVRLVAIGSSTGGPLVLQQIFSILPKDFPVPIIVVQHITDGFVDGFADWLKDTSSFPVSVAVNGEMMLPGHAYIAPNGSHAAVNGLGRIVLKKSAPENGHFPSVSFLFRSVTAAYGRDAVGVLLTGMGKDGAEELGLMKNKGAITLVQDKESSVVHGMPGAAIALDAATYVLTPEKIAAALVDMAYASQDERSSK